MVSNQTDDSRVEHSEHENNVEVEAISHKEQRKRRKMEKYMSQHSEGDVNLKPSKPQRSPYSVWIGNLAFSTSVEELTEWLQEQGIEGISRVHMISGVRREEHNRGFAYVDLPSQDQVERCIALSESSLKVEICSSKEAQTFADVQVSILRRLNSEVTRIMVERGSARQHSEFYGARKIHPLPPCLSVI